MEVDSDSDSDSETFSDFEFYDVPVNNVNTSPVAYGPYNKLILGDWNQCGLHHGVLLAFDKMNITEMTLIQKHCLSYLRNNLNTAIIGASKGKSISYLAHIISSMMFDKDEIKSLVIGPNVIILTNSLQLCKELENLIKIFLSVLIEKINVLVVDPFISKSVLEASLIHGCNILISTPYNLNQFLKQMKCFSWFNLRYIVLENLDILLDDYGEEMVTILETYMGLKNYLSKIQFVSTSVRWTNDVDEFLENFFYEWQYIFGCHLEAARYMNTEFYVVHLKKNKLKMISWYLENNFTSGRLVLISSNRDELSFIRSYIQEFNSDIDVLLGYPDRSDLTLKKWNSSLEKKQRLLICSDDMMFDHYIDNADYLIHFDIPAKEFKFEERFSFLKDSNNMPKKNGRSSYVFLSEAAQDMSMMPKVVETMKYSDGIDMVLQQVAKKMINTQEKEKKTVLCNKLLQFGDCPEQLSCKDRHIVIKKLDKPANNIPMSGLAEVQILHYYDASHMSAKLLNLNSTYNLTDNKNWYTVDDNTDIVKCELSLFYSNPESRISLQNLKPGDKVAVELETNINEVMKLEYFRAIVIDIIDKNTMNSKVKVKFVDKGSLEIVSKCKVYSLPHHLEKLKTTTVDLILLSVKPTYFDKIWNPKANLDVIEKIVSVSPVIVDVQFSLGNTMFINKMYSKWFSPTLNKSENEIILPNMLFDGYYGIENPLHYKKLQELILSAGINLLPSLEAKKDEDNNKLNIGRTMPNFNDVTEWAYLDETINLVDINTFLSPKCFFVRNSSSTEPLRSLQKYINKCIEQKKIESFTNITEGAYCLALHDETELFCRVKILKIINDSLIEVFFVDFGDFDDVESNSLYTFGSILTILPFQAIECSLHDVKKISSTELALLNSKILLAKGSLRVEVVHVKSRAKLTDGCHYKVILYDKDCNVNSQLREIYHNYNNVSSDDDSSSDDVPSSDDDSRDDVEC